MIEELFEKDRPVFVRFDVDRFRVGRRKRDTLHGLLTDMLPVRKRFEGRRLACWSNDSLVGRDGQRCALCRQRWSCSQRLRLMLLLDGLDQDAIPAILEIGYGSFPAFETFLSDVEADDRGNRPIAIDMHRSQGRLRFTFHSPRPQTQT